MATSGTIGATSVDVTSFIEHAFRRAGVPSSKITGEQQLAARDNLFFILTDLANRGVNLWCIAKQLVALTVGQATYPLAAGVADLLRAFVRTMIYPTGLPISTATTLGVDTGASGAAIVTTVGVTVTSSVSLQTLVVEYSPDGSTWNSAYAIPAFTGVAGQLYWFDLPIVIGARAWCVRETVAVAIACSGAQFGTTPSDILMAKLSRDDYWNLPNKAAAGKPLQYWFDKQIVPQITVWQVPNDATQLIVAEEHLLVQDVGALTNTLFLPQRWYNWCAWELSVYCAAERPPEERNPDVISFCEKRAMQSMVGAEMGETDGAPIKILPNIRAYTR